MNLSMEIAEWVNKDLRESIDETLRYRATRLFAVNKTANGYERRLVDSDPDPYDLIRRLPKPDKVDAYCLVMTGWMTPIADGDDDEQINSPYNDERVRVRLCAAVSDAGVSVRVQRWVNGYPEGDSFEDGGEGSFPDALRLWWDATQGRNNLFELMGD
jgi:hypothetical protein